MHFLTSLVFVLGVCSLQCSAAPVDHDTETENSGWSLATAVDMLNFFIQKSQTKPDDESFWDPRFLLPTGMDYLKTKWYGDTDSAADPDEPSEDSETPEHRRPKRKPKKKTTKHVKKSSNDSHTEEEEQPKRKSRPSHEQGRMDPEETTAMNATVVIDHMLADPSTRNSTIEFARSILSRAKQTESHAKKSRPKSSEKSRALTKDSGHTKKRVVPSNCTDEATTSVLVKALEGKTSRVPKNAPETSPSPKPTAQPARTWTQWLTGR